MKKILAPLIFAAFALAGCEDGQIIRSAQWSVDRVSYRGGDHFYLEYRDGMYRRQRHWDEYNRRHWGRRPGWCSPFPQSDGYDPICHPYGPMPVVANKRGRAPALESFSVSGPRLSQADALLYSRIGGAYGIHPDAATLVLESLNRAAVGDFGGLAGLGLGRESLALAERNNGRIAAAELDRLSRLLGVNQSKLDSLIRDLLSRR